MKYFYFYNFYYSLWRNTMLNSLKQLLRTPLKAVLFFLLMTASSLLLVFGSVMLVQSMQRINAAEAQFTTIGTVEQIPVKTWNEMITWNKLWGDYTDKVNEYNDALSVDILKFEGADYINEPESRPYYQTYLPDYTRTTTESIYSTYILEFTPLEDCSLSTPSDVRVNKILFNNEADRDVALRPQLNVKATLEEGDIIQLNDFSVENPKPLEGGKKYICNLVWSARGGAGYYMVYPPPFSSQYGAEDGYAMIPEQIRNGKEVVPFPYRLFEYTLSTPPCPRTEEVTTDFYDNGGRGQAWLTWVEMHEKYNGWLLVLPTNNLQLLPSFHDRQAYVQKGREITNEEFETGAQVCMISADFANQNQLTPGDKINLPLSYALYGYIPELGRAIAQEGLCYPTYFKGYSPLDSDMKPYEPFWTAEYEIVGTYQPLETSSLICGTTELARDMFIIPSKSVKASDENNIASYGPMNTLTTSFQIPNGTIEEFDAKLRAAVPEVEQLNITYNDNGYTEVIATLNTARLAAILLFAVGLLATLAIVILLLFFFIVKQKKRTAVERSLGMSKKQCRKSLIAGVIILTLAAAIVGSACGAVILNTMDSSNDDITETTEFSTDYSLWAANKPAAEVKLDTADVIVTTSLYIAIPLLLVLFVYLLALFLVERNLKIEPILLLSTKVE